MHRVHWFCRRTGKSERLVPDIRSFSLVHEPKNVLGEKHLASISTRSYRYFVLHTTQVHISVCKQKKVYCTASAKEDQAAYLAGFPAFLITGIQLFGLLFNTGGLAVGFSEADLDPSFPKKTISLTQEQTGKQANRIMKDLVDKHRGFGRKFLFKSELQFLPFKLIPWKAKKIQISTKSFYNFSYQVDFLLHGSGFASGSGCAWRLMRIYDPDPKNTTYVDLQHWQTIKNGDG